MPAAALLPTVRAAFAAESATLGLRMRLFPGVDTAMILPVLAVLTWGAYLISTGHATVGVVASDVAPADEALLPGFRLDRALALSLHHSPPGNYLGVVCSGGLPTLGRGKCVPPVLA